MSRELTYPARITKAKANLKQFAKDLALHVEAVPVLAGEFPILDSDGWMPATIFSPSMRKSTKRCDVRMPSTIAKHVFVDETKLPWHAALDAAREKLR